MPEENPVRPLVEELSAPARLSELDPYTNLFGEFAFNELFEDALPLRPDADKPAEKVAKRDSGETPQERRPAEVPRSREVEELRRTNAPLEGVELQRANYLQRTLSNLTPLFVDNLPRRENETESQYRDRLQDDIRQQKVRLQLEETAGVFGPATRQCYEKYVSWLQSRAIPEAVREVDSLQLAMPAGCPIALPLDQYQRSMSPDLYKAMAANNELSLNMSLDTARLPSESQLQQLDQAYEWLAKCNELAVYARGEHQDRVLNQLLGDMGLPSSWRRQQGEDPAAWRASAAEMVDLATRTRNYIEAMQSLYKTSRDHDFPLDLPLGTRLVLDVGGQRKEVTTRDLNEPEAKGWLKSGSIREVHLDLPADLRQDHPANAQKISRLRDWITNNGDRIDQSVKALVDVQNRPETVIMCGDQELRNARGRFNRNNEFLGVAGPQYQPGPNETLRETNLIGYNFDVERLDNGKFRITQNVQAENAPWYAYQNFRFLGIEKVGNPMAINARELDGDAFVPVKSGDKIEIIQVKNLARFKAAQQFAYWGEKGLVATMDAAMLVSGTIEVGAAVRGARLAATGATAALKLTGTEAAWQVAHGVTRVTVAGAGILNNAGGRSLQVGDWRVGEHVNTARGLYFLGDVSLGLARGGWSAFRAARSADAPLGAAERVHTIIHGREALNGAEAIKGIPFVRQAHTGTTWAFKATEYAFAPVIASELSHQVQRIRDLGQRDPSRDAVTQLGDGRGLQRAAAGSFNPADRRVVEGTRAVLENYSAILKDGRADSVQREIQQIFDQTKGLIGADVKPEDRRAFMQRMLANQSFTGEEIRDLELAHPQGRNQEGFHLTAEQLRDLGDPEKRKTFPRAVQEAAERFLNAKNADIAVASRIAMLYAARDADGRVPASLAQVELDVPAYKKTITHTGSNGQSVQREVEVSARRVAMSVSTAETVAFLKRDLEARNLGNRGIVSGEVLTRIGALTHQQYGGVLQDILNNGSSSKSDKMRALVDAYGARIVNVVDGTRFLEGQPRNNQSAVEKQRELGQHFGLSSQDLIKTLEKTARTEQDADVRAMAAAQLYGINEKDPRRRTELLSALNTMWHECRDRNGEFARRSVELLRRDMLASVPEDARLGDWVRERKLNAALSLAMVTPLTDAEGLRSINRAIAESYSASKPELALKALDALLPDRIARLTVTDAVVTNNLRASLVDLTRTVPDSRAKEEWLVKVLEKVPALLAGGDTAIKQQLVRNLESLLDNNQYNRNYAEHYPALRVAAIKVLADLGSRDSLDAIRRHATAEAKIPLSGKQLDAAEPNAVVRMEAVKALERLQDPELRSYLALLIDKETDPQVSARLRDIRFFQQRLEPSDREYQEIRQQIEAQIINPANEAGYRHMAQFGQQRARDWLNENFPILNAVTYRERAQHAIDDAAYGFPNVFRSRESILNMERQGALPVQTERKEAWDRLVNMAKGSGEDADRARRALYYIATSPVADMLGESSGDVGLYSDYDNDVKFTGFRHLNWRLEAASALAAAGGIGTSSRDMTAHYIEQGLTSTSGLGAESRLELLNGLKELARPDNRGNVGISRERLARTLTRALALEFARPAADQSQEYQLRLVRELKEMNYRMAVPVFDGMARSRFDAVKTEAGEALTALRDSVNLIWEQTREDQNATTQQRADRVRTALGDANKAEITVQEICSAYKGVQISDARDPGLAQLQVAMQDTNERVRLVAAKVLMESKLPANNPVKAKAIQVLAGIVAGSPTAGYRTDAYAELGRLELAAPIHLMIPGSNRLLKVEKVAGQVKATQFDGNTEVGWIYPGGGSMCIFKDAEGNLNRVIENGTEYRRKSEGGRLIDEWTNTTTGRAWKGRFEMIGTNGSYWYQTANHEKRHTREVNGRWTETNAPKN